MDNRTLSQQAYEYLRQEILAHRLAPGQRLREIELAERMNISRAPIREALQALAAEGLVTIYPRRGAIVARLSPKEFLEFSQVREALEALAVRLAVPYLSSDDIETLNNINEAMRQEGQVHNVDRFFELNARFHALFVQRSGNSFLQDIYSQLMDHLKRYRLKTVHLRKGIEHSVIEHEGILEAVERLDPDEAARLMAEHIRVPREVIERSKMAWTDASAPDEGKSTKSEVSHGDLRR